MTHPSVIANQMTKVDLMDKIRELEVEADHYEAEMVRLKEVIKAQNQDLRDLRAYRDKASQIFENGGCPPGKGFDYGLCPTVKGKCEGCIKRYIREGK